MALTASGQLSLGDIATEMGVSLSNVSLTTQSTTGINTNSESKPDGSTPHAISEFYSYDHSASPPLTAFSCRCRIHMRMERGLVLKVAQVQNGITMGRVNTQLQEIQYIPIRVVLRFQKMDFIGWMNRHHFLWKVVL
jgi:hypothetical protein